MLGCVNSLFHASLLAFLALLHRAFLVAGFATQGFPGLWSRSLGTPLCAEWGGGGGTSDLPPSMKKKSGCCEPGTFQPIQKFFVGRKAHQVTSLFLGSWQWQRVGVMQLNGMRQRMFKTQFTSVSQPILGLGKGRCSKKEGPGELYDIPKVAFSSHLAMEASKVRIVGKLYAHASFIHHVMGAWTFLATEHGRW